MTDFALMTVRITLLDRDMTIDVGGPVDQAIALKLRLADEFNLQVPVESSCLCLALTMGDFLEIVAPILSEFPSIGWCHAKVKSEFEEKVDLVRQSLSLASPQSR